VFGTFLLFFDYYFSLKVGKKSYFCILLAAAIPLPARAWPVALAANFSNNESRGVLLGET
jgi:hypothetical protein